jgi:L-cysteate sulfo-lyase
VKPFDEAIARFPRIALMSAPTPIERLVRIEEAMGERLGGVRLYVKRDDVMALGGGGNKLRKLEFLLGDARAKGADTIITVGGRQSNHARLTAAAAAKVGLRCELVLAQMVRRGDADYLENGNVLLDRLFGARIHDLPGSADALEFANARAAEIGAKGGHAYVAPAGGSSPVGCLGYAACAREIEAQSRSMGVSFDQIIVPNGSSGTHAGLAAGLVALGLPVSRVRSFSVLADLEPTRRATIDKASATLALLGGDAALDEAEIRVDGSQRGPAYGVPTEAMIQAVRLMASREGLLLDPVYSGKAFAGVLAAIAGGQFASGSNLLFIMTGGTPGLFAYRSEFPDAEG